MKNRDSIQVVALIAGTMAVAGWLCFKLLPDGRNAPAKAQKSIMTPGAGAASPPAESRREGMRLMIPVRAQVGGIELPATPAPDARPAAPATQEERPAPGVVEQAAKLAAEGKKTEARAALTEAILAAEEGPARDEMRVLLEQINAELFFSRSPSPDCAFYRVQRGDTLDRIIKAETKPRKDIYFAGVIMQVNGIANERRIREKQNLKIPQGTFSALIQKRAHRLIVLFNGQYIKEYPVTLGAAATPTPEGKFVVDSKQVNPDWYAPDGAVYKFNDPRNILGTRWIGLQETPEYQGYGIHGTTDPQSIGKDASNGCVRMLNADVEEIFGMLMLGETVTVVK